MQTRGQPLKLRHILSHMEQLQAADIHKLPSSPPFFHTAVMTSPSWWKVPTPMIGLNHSLTNSGTDRHATRLAGYKMEGFLQRCCQYLKLEASPLLTRYELIPTTVLDYPSAHLCRARRVNYIVSWIALTTRTHYTSSVSNCCARCAHTWTYCPHRPAHGKCGPSFFVVRYHARL
jgi:hypothetical protein